MALMTLSIKVWENWVIKVASGCAFDNLSSLRYMAALECIFYTCLLSCVFKKDMHAHVHVVCVCAIHLILLLMCVM